MSQIDGDASDRALAPPDRASTPRPDPSAHRPVTSRETVIRLAGVVTPAAVMSLHRDASLALASGARSIVLDLTEVEVLGARVAALLCGALRRVDRSGRHVSFVGGPHHVRRILGVLWLLPQRGSYEPAPGGTAVGRELWLAVDNEVIEPRPVVSPPTLRIVDTSEDGARRPSKRQPSTHAEGET